MAHRGGLLLLLAGAVEAWHHPQKHHDQHRLSQLSFQASVVQSWSRRGCHRRRRSSSGDSPDGGQHRGRLQLCNNEIGTGALNSGCSGSSTCRRSRRRRLGVSWGQLWAAPRDPARDEPPSAARGFAPPELAEPSAAAASFQASLGGMLGGFPQLIPKKRSDHDKEEEGKIVVEEDQKEEEEEEEEEKKGEEEGREESKKIETVEQSERTKELAGELEVYRNRCVLLQGKLLEVQRAAAEKTARSAELELSVAEALQMAKVASENALDERKRSRHLEAELDALEESSQVLTAELSGECTRLRKALQESSKEIEAAGQFASKLKVKYQQQLGRMEASMGDLEMELSRVENEYSRTRREWRSVEEGLVGQLNKFRNRTVLLQEELGRGRRRLAQATQGLFAAEADNAGLRAELGSLQATSDLLSELGLRDLDDSQAAAVGDTEDGAGSSSNSNSDSKRRALRVAQELKRLRDDMQERDKAHAAELQALRSDLLEAEEEHREELALAEEEQAAMGSEWEEDVRRLRRAVGDRSDALGELQARLRGEVEQRDKHIERLDGLVRELQGELREQEEEAREMEAQYQQQQQQQQRVDRDWDRRDGGRAGTQERLSASGGHARGTSRGEGRSAYGYGQEEYEPPRPPHQQQQKRDGWGWGHSTGQPQGQQQGQQQGKKGKRGWASGGSRGSGQRRQRVSAEGERKWQKACQDMQFLD